MDVVGSLPGNLIKFQICFVNSTQVYSPFCVKVVEIKPGHLLENAKDLDLFPGFNLEGYPNRDSTVYIEKYGLNDVKTMLRGTLRYKVRIGPNICRF